MAVSPPRPAASSPHTREAPLLTELVGELFRGYSFLPSFLPCQTTLGPGRCQLPPAPNPHDPCTADLAFGPSKELIRQGAPTSLRQSCFGLPAGGAGHPWVLLMCPSAPPRPHGPTTRRSRWEQPAFVKGCVHGHRQLHDIVNSLGVLDLLCGQALDLLLHQKAEHLVRVFRAPTIPLRKRGRVGRSARSGRGIGV